MAQHACGSSLSHARLAQLSFGVERSILTADEARELIVEQPWLLSGEFATSYEDDHLVVANKPWDVHLGPDKGGQPRWAGERNLRDWLAHEYPSTTTPDGEVRLCHNLDFATSGLICAATSRVAANDVSRCFRDRVARKLYVALCHGHPAWSSARWEARIQPSTRKFKQRISGGGKKALTDVSVAARGTLRVGEHKGKAACLLWLQPHTGRRHQLRLHCAHGGHPIVGDLTYTGDRLYYRTFLHAAALVLPLAEPPHRPAEPVRVAAPIEPAAWANVFEAETPLSSPEGWPWPEAAADVLGRCAP